LRYGLKLRTTNLEPFLKRFGYKTRTDATGTDFDRPDSTVSDRFNLLKIWIPDGTGFVVCMAYIISKAGTFAADYTYS
jgi:hypothetical protein